jgi:hypothetical protein
MEDRGGAQTAIREERQASLVIPSPEQEDACTQFLASDLTMRLDRVMRAWFLRKDSARYHELQKLLIEELERKDNTMQEHPMSRRDVLRRLASAPVELYSLKLTAPMLIYAPDEFLPRCAAGITACYYLRKGKDLAFVSDTVSRYILTLEDLVTNGKGTQRKDAAELLAQCLLLKGLCVNHTHADPLAALAYAKQAESYAKLAGHPMLTIVIVRQQATFSDYAEDWEQALSTAERAKNIMEAANQGKTAEDAPVSSRVQSFVHAGLADFQAHGGRVQEALKSLRLAEETFEASKDEPLPPVWVTYDEASLYQREGLTYSRLDNQTAAITSFARIDGLADAPEVLRTDSFTAQVMAELNRSDKPRDMEFCLENWQKSLLGAIATQSRQQFKEAKVAYVAIRAAWPSEQRIKKLSEQIRPW